MIKTTSKFVDIQGQKFGMLTAVEPVYGNPHRMWKCLCECGKEIITEGWALRGGGKRSCGCNWHRSADLTGKRFNHLVVEGRNGIDKNGRAMWLCRCDCGNRRDVPTRYLLRGSRRHCGCRDKEDHFAVGLKHRLSDKDRAVNHKMSEYMSNAKHKGLAFLLDRTTFTDLVLGKCHYCGADPMPTNGIDRMDNALGYTQNNSVSCCTRCNYFKGSMSKDMFISLMAHIITYLSNT